MLPPSLIPFPNAQSPTSDLRLAYPLIPALMTPCTPDRRPDFDALARRGRALVDLGMRAVVYCGSMGDWPLLTDAQRMEGVEALVALGVPDLSTVNFRGTNDGELLGVARSGQ